MKSEHLCGAVMKVDSHCLQRDTCPSSRVNLMLIQSIGWVKKAGLNLDLQARQHPSLLHAHRFSAVSWTNMHVQQDLFNTYAELSCD